MILIPFNSTCESRDSDYPLSIFSSPMDYPITSYLQITNVFEKTTLEKVNALMLEEAFKGTPLLLDILITHPFMPHVQLALKSLDLEDY